MAPINGPVAILMILVNSSQDCVSKKEVMMDTDKRMNKQSHLETNMSGYANI